MNIILIHISNTQRHLATNTDILLRRCVENRIHEVRSLLLAYRWQYAFGFNYFLNGIL